MTVKQLKEELNKHGVPFQNKLQKAGLVKLVMEIGPDKPPPKKQATSSPAGARAKTAGYQAPSKSDPTKTKQRGSFSNSYTKTSQTAVLDICASCFEG